MIIKKATYQDQLKNILKKENGEVSVLIIIL